MHIPVVTLPMLHPGQAEAFYKTVEHDYVAIRCGRRWGKTQLIETIACRCGMQGLAGRHLCKPDYTRSCQRPITRC